MPIKIPVNPVMIRWRCWMAFSIIAVVVSPRTASGGAYLCVYVCVCERERVCVCVCVERERESGNARAGARARERKRQPACVCACECIYVCAQVRGFVFACASVRAGECAFSFWLYDFIVWCMRHLESK